MELCEDTVYLDMVCPLWRSRSSSVFDLPSAALANHLLSVVLSFFYMIRSLVVFWHCNFSSSPSFILYTTAKISCMIPSKVVRFSISWFHEARLSCSSPHLTQTGGNMQYAWVWPYCWYRLHCTTAFFGLGDSAVILVCKGILNYILIYFSKSAPGQQRIAAGEL